MAPLHRRKKKKLNFYTSILRRSVLSDWVWWAGGRPHNKFSSVYRIFTKLGHMIPMWKRKNPIYFGVIRSKVKITITINIIVDNRIVSARLLVLYIGSLPNLATLFPCGRRRTLFILGSLPLYRLIIYIDRRILWCTHFLLLSGLQTIRYLGWRNS